MKKRILVVDDEPSVRKIIKRVINEPCYELFEADNGIEALQIFQRETLDLIITDIIMAEKNSIDLIMEVKKKNKALPIIAISGGDGITGRFNYLEIAKLVGAENILSKPFDNSELKNIAEATLGSNE